MPYVGGAEGECVETLRHKGPDLDDTLESHMRYDTEEAIFFIIYEENLSGHTTETHLM